MSEAQRRPEFFVIALLVVIAWFGIGGFAGPLAGQLSDVQTNSNAEFLPENSETTTASVKLEKFASSGAAEVIPMTIVFERTQGGFTAEDFPASSNRSFRSRR
jgi:RND superfamily putative drug exporter